MSTLTDPDQGENVPGRGASQQLVDVVLALGALGGTLALLAHGALGGPGGIDGDVRARLDATGALLAACASLPLLGWRRAPLGVFAATALASALLNALGYPPGPPLGPTIALYLLAASRTDAAPWTRRTTAAVAGLLAIHVGGIGLAEGKLPGLPLVFGVLVWTIAWFAGERTRLRRARISELEARARAALRDVERERQLAAAQERTRIARDLHDSAGHAINVILVHAGAARLLQPTDPRASQAALQTIEDVARQTVGEIDHLVRTLREDTDGRVESPLGLAALDELVERHSAAGLVVTLTGGVAGTKLAPRVDQAAYRILQEALTNAARHGSGRATVDLRFSADDLAITVSNPVGSPNAARSNGGHGLVGMRERTELLEGSLETELTAGVFSVRASLPYARAAH